MNLKEQLESARKYALERIEKGEFNLVDCYYDKNIECARVLIEIDSYRLDLAVYNENNYMFQLVTQTKSGIILFYNAINIPARIKELAEKSEIKRLEEKLKELKNQLS